MGKALKRNLDDLLDKKVSKEEMERRKKLFNDWIYGLTNKDKKKD